MVDRVRVDDATVAAHLTTVARSMSRKRHDLFVSDTRYMAPLAHRVGSLGREGAVQVQRSHSGWLLRHRRAGDRLLRAVQPVLRPRTRRVLALARSAAPRGRGRLRHARERRRVLRARSVRRRARDLRPRLPHRPHERHVPVRGLQDAGRHCCSSPRTRRSCTSTSTSGRRCPSRTTTAPELVELEGDDVEH